MTDALMPGYAHILNPGIKTHCVAACTQIKTVDVLMFLDKTDRPWSKDELLH